MVKFNLKNNLYIISLIVVFVDQISKFFFEKNFVLNQTVPIIKNVFHFTLIHNTGAGFGILQGTNTLLAWLSLIVLGIILFYWDQIKTNQQKIFIALIAGGITGNLIDRIFFGHIIDFIDFRIWPVFNIADSCMVVGVIGLLYSLYKYSSYKNHSSKNK